MKRVMMALAMSIMVCSCAHTQKQQSETVKATEDAVTASRKGTNMSVIIETSLGTIKADLWADKSPETVKNFLQYTDDKFFDGLIFHRVMDGFMIQGGGFSPDMKQKATRGPVKNEARSDVKNKRGTLAMARTQVVDSATAQFFINLVDNGFLDHSNNTPQGFGYCVFGQVTEGMDVVDKIAKVKTTTKGFNENVPVEPVVIKSIRRTDAK